MKKIIFTLLCGLIFTANYGQTYKWLKNSRDGYSITVTPSITPLATAADFTVTFTDGSTQSLYATLAQGKTVLLDFFFTTCAYCIQYAPTIDQSYVAHGSGSNNIVYWGLDDGDNNSAVVAYKSAHGVTNPCASGVEGNASAVGTLYGVSGYPTYAVVCPNKNLSFDVNYPPTATGFDSYFTTCAASTGVNEYSTANGSISNMYPNPSTGSTFVEFNLKESSDLRFEIYNTLGEKVFYYEEAKIGAGNNRLIIPSANLANGIYVVKMIQNDKVSDVRKLVVEK